MEQTYCSLYGCDKLCSFISSKTNKLAFLYPSLCSHTFWLYSNHQQKRTLLCFQYGPLKLHKFINFGRGTSYNFIDLFLCQYCFVLPSIFPSIRVFSNELTLHIMWPKDWSFSFGISAHSPIFIWIPRLFSLNFFFWNTLNCLLALHY